MWIKFLPYIFCVVFGAGVGSYGTLQLAKLTKQEVKVSCPACPQCPEQKPCNGLDLDKLKGKYITLTVQQHITSNIGDSLLIQKMDALFTQRLTDLKVVRAKK